MLLQWSFARVRLTRSWFYLIVSSLACAKTEVKFLPAVHVGNLSIRFFHGLGYSRFYQLKKFRLRFCIKLIFYVFIENIFINNKMNFNKFSIHFVA